MSAAWHAPSGVATTVPHPAAYDRPVSAPAGALSPATVEAVLGRLGFSSRPSNDLDGLAALYRAWCRSVPFDNVRKVIALRTGAPGNLPGMDPEDFVTTWLAHGCGGTCWPSATALDALARATGFDARLVAASMMDTGTPSHGTTIVAVDAGEWLIDSSMLTEVPLRLDRAAPTHTEHPVLAASAAPVPQGWLFGFSLATSAETMPCRTMSPDRIEPSFAIERFERSREMSPFNDQPVVRRNLDADLALWYGGGRRYERTLSGVRETPLAGADLAAALVAEIGMSEEIVERLVRSGAIGQALA